MSERWVGDTMTSTQQKTLNKNKNLLIKFLNSEDRKLLSFLLGTGLETKRFKNYDNLRVKKNQSETLNHWDSKK